MFAVAFLISQTMFILYVFYMYLSITIFTALPLTTVLVSVLEATACPGREIHSLLARMSPPIRLLNVSNLSHGAPGPQPKHSTCPDFRKSLKTFRIISLLTL